MNTVVRASWQEYLHLLAYQRASAEINGWISGARALALLNTAMDSGILKALQSGNSLTQIAASSNLDLQSVNDLCTALEAHGIAMQTDGLFQLTPDYAMMMSPESAVPLANLVYQGRVMIQSLQTGHPLDATYTGLQPEDVLAMAEGSGISLLSSSPHVSQESTGQMLPEIEALWQAGAHHLEVGCGVGNALLGIALTYPRITAVGIEIEPHTATEAERRAGLLGLAERVCVRRMDACDLQDEGQYDTVQWSQFFFPAATRPVVLQAMYRALKPGGYLLMPLMGALSEKPSTRRREMARNTWRALWSGGFTFVSFLNDLLSESSGRRRKERRFIAIQRLLFRWWGVPLRSSEELSAEVEDCGFRVVRSLYTPVNQFVLTRGFLLAQRADH